MNTASFLADGFGITLAIIALLVCVVWLIFPFMAMNRLRGIREEIERGNRYLAHFFDASSSSPEESFPRPTIRMVPTARMIPTVKVVPIASVVAPPSVVPLKISKGGQELGLKDTTSIKVMLKRGDLTLKDRYFDAMSNQWVTLECHPEFS